MKYQIIGWMTVVSVAIWAAPFVYAMYDLIQWR
jgi:hypothetical protein